MAIFGSSATQVNAVETNLLSRGMFRALRDPKVHTTLDRDVAIKVLPGRQGG